MHDNIKNVLYDEKQIADAVKRIGKRISADYAGRRPLLLCVLKGASVFHSDLMRVVDLPCDIDFIIVKSYGMNAQSSGDVKIIKESDIEITGRDVIIVEDILDTGKTLSALIHTFKNKGAATVKTAVLLDKDIGADKPAQADYKCFDVHNEFVVGYGLDYAEGYRNLPYIGVLKDNIYN